ncbi:hypothetical protein CLOM_g10927 [Closterium sp. NIES-68]|nr:hypothetical protein CLOM_g10927 [Closterium sp. NIES-68]
MWQQGVAALVTGGAWAAVAAGRQQGATGHIPVHFTVHSGCSSSVRAASAESGGVHVCVDVGEHVRVCVVAGDESVITVAAVAMVAAVVSMGYGGGSGAALYGRPLLSVSGEVSQWGGQ